jgi:hypothetical protein
MRNFVFFFILLVILGACGGETSKEAVDASKPESKGGLLEILVITEKKRWDGRVGAALREILMESQPGLPQEEPRFTVVNIAPKDFGRFLRNHHNILMVTSLNDTTGGSNNMRRFFTSQTLSSIRKDTNKVMLAKSDEFARGQRTLFVFGKDDYDLVKNIERQREQILEYFQKAERDRMLRKLIGNGDNEQTKLEDLIFDKSGLQMRIPTGYLMARNDSNFVWLRKMGNPDRNLLITYGEYTSEKMFEVDNIVNWRNTFGFKFMNDTTLKNSYMDTQHKELPVEAKKINVDGKFVVEYRGLWALKNKSRGGPFLGYALVDEKKRRFYYIEGFVYAPNEKKRKPILELESILRTFYLGNKKAKRS